MNKEGQDVCNYILSIIDSSQKYSLPEWEEHPEATNNIAMVWNTAATPWLDWRGHRISVRSLEKLPGFDSLLQEQTLTDCNELQEPEVDLDSKVTFDCISKRVTMTVQELINYYIDRECCDVAEECGF